MIYKLICDNCNECFGTIEINSFDFYMDKADDLFCKKCSNQEKGELK